MYINEGKHNESQHALQHFNLRISIACWSLKFDGNSRSLCVEGGNPKTSSADSTLWMLQEIQQNGRNCDKMEQDGTT